VPFCISPAALTTWRLVGPYWVITAENGSTTKKQNRDRHWMLVLQTRSAGTLYFWDLRQRRLSPPTIGQGPITEKIPDEKSIF
jgi:hypothetical protein